jgi:putative endonuclease
MKSSSLQPSDSFPDLGIVNSFSGKFVFLVTVEEHAPHYDPRLLMPARLTRLAIGILDRLARMFLADDSPQHLRTGMRGEEDAFFELRKLGYVMVARNMRSPRSHGEIDLIAWDGDVLCFIEVKTRTSHDVKAAEAAVDRHKRREIAEVIREYLRAVPRLCQWRFDIVSVYYDGSNSRPQFELFRNASLAA